MVHAWCMVHERFIYLSNINGSPSSWLISCCSLLFIFLFYILHLQRLKKFEISFSIKIQDMRYMLVYVHVQAHTLTHTHTHIDTDTDTLIQYVKISTTILTTLTNTWIPTRTTTMNSKFSSCECPNCSFNISNKSDMTSNLWFNNSTRWLISKYPLIAW